MHRYASQVLGYAIALFTCYGVFVGMGLGGTGWCPLFLLLGTAAALSVIVLNSTQATVLPSSITVLLFCALGFAVGWGGHQMLRWVALLVGLVAERTR